MFTACHSSHSCPHLLLQLLLRENIRKKSCFLLDIFQKAGGVQPESKSFEVVLFSPILTLFWTLNGGGEGGSPCSKSFEALFA